MHDTLHANGVTVDTVTFVTLGDLTYGVPVELGFVGFTVAGVPGPTVDCGTGVYAATTATTFHVRRHQPGTTGRDDSGARHRRLELTEQPADRAWADAVPTRWSTPTVTPTAP